MHLIIGYSGHHDVRDTLLFGAIQLKEPLRNFSMWTHLDTNKDTTFGHSVCNVEFPDALLCSELLWSYFCRHVQILPYPLH